MGKRGYRRFPLSANSGIHELSEGKKVKFESLVTDGGHTWMNVKNYVATTAPMLFK